MPPRSRPPVRAPSVALAAGLLLASAALVTSGCGDEADTSPSPPPSVASDEEARGIGAAFERLVSISQVQDSAAYDRLRCSSGDPVSDRHQRATFPPISVVDRDPPEMSGQGAGSVTALIRVPNSEPVRVTFEFALEAGEWRYCPTAALVRIN